MTSPPAQHDPRDDRPGRDDADAHPPLGRVEAGPQRHSDDRRAKGSPRAIVEVGGYQFGFPSQRKAERLQAAVAAALRAVDRAAREECARIAVDSSMSITYMGKDQADGGIIAGRCIEGALLHSIKP